MSTKPKSTSPIGMARTSGNDTHAKSARQSDAHSQHSLDSSPGDAVTQEQNKTQSDGAPVQPEVERRQAVTPGVQYSVFTTGQKRAIVLAGSFAAFFSPMTGKHLLSSPHHNCKRPQCVSFKHQPHRHDLPRMARRCANADRRFQ